MTRQFQPTDPIRLYSNDELCRFFIEAPKYEYLPYWRSKFFLVRFILGTGLRVSEVLRVRVPEDANMEGIVTVRISKNGRARKCKVSPELEPHYLQRIRMSEPGSLFPGVTNTRTLERWHDEAMAVCGIEKRVGRCCHALRHQFATEELNSERLPVWKVSRQLGHSSDRITLDTYTHCLVARMYGDKIPKWWALAARHNNLRALENVGCLNLTSN